MDSQVKKLFTRTTDGHFPVVVEREGADDPGDDVIMFYGNHASKLADEYVKWKNENENKSH